MYDRQTPCSTDTHILYILYRPHSALTLRQTPIYICIVPTLHTLTLTQTHTHTHTQTYRIHSSLTLTLTHTHTHTLRQTLRTPHSHSHALTHTLRQTPICVILFNISYSLRFVDKELGLGLECTSALPVSACGARHFST